VEVGSSQSLSYPKAAAKNRTLLLFLVTRKVIKMLKYTNFIKNDQNYHLNVKNNVFFYPTFFQPSFLIRKIIFNFINDQKFLL